MGLLAQHPQYKAMLPKVEMNRTFYNGAEAVKAETTTYLPATPGMIIDGMGSTAKGPKVGQAAYNCYIARAYVPDTYKEAVEKKIGLIHKKPVVVNVPKGMEYILTDANVKGGDIYSLFREITFEQLVGGRAFLLGDIVSKNNVANFALALYKFEDVPNWDDDAIGSDAHRLKLVFLDESGYERDSDFEWSEVTKIRVLRVSNDESMNPVYMAGEFKVTGDGEPTFTESDMAAVTYYGKSLSEIPGTFINSKDLFAEPDEPPLSGLARAVAAIYRLEADYRQALFMQTQDTFVVKGDVMGNTKSDNASEDDIRIGAGSFLQIEKDGDAGYKGVNSNGLGELRQALENDYKRADAVASVLVNTGTSQESGEALKTRVSANTATLRQIAITAAKGLERILRDIATIMNLDPKEVTVNPNLDFADSALATQTVVELLTAKNLGAPLSYESIHTILRELNLTEKTFMEELDAITEESEDPRIEMLRQIMTGGSSSNKSDTPSGVDDPAKAADPQFNTNPGGVSG